jgi:hypothetical protein
MGVGGGWKKLVERKYVVESLRTTTRYATTATSNEEETHKHSAVIDNREIQYSDPYGGFRFLLSALMVKEWLRLDLPRC